MDKSELEKMIEMKAERAVRREINEAVDLVKKNAVLSRLMIGETHLSSSCGGQYNCQAGEAVIGNEPNEKMTNIAEVTGERKKYYVEKFTVEVLDQLSDIKRLFDEREED